MVARTYLGGPTDQAASFNPAGVPVDGDTLDTAGLPITFVENITFGADDGSPAITNPTQYPAGAEAAPISVAVGVTVSLSGRIDNSNGDLDLAPGSKLTFTNSDDQILDFGAFDNVSATAPTLQMDNAVLEHVGSGSMRLAMNQGGALDLTEAIISGIGNGTDIMTANIQSDAGQLCRTRNAYFVRCRGDLNVQCFGNGTMGDIDVDGLYNIDPITGGGINFAGNVDATLHPTANVRSVKNVRAEGNVNLTFLQGYTSVSGLRTTEGLLTIAGSADAEDLSEWFIGNHGASSFVAIGDHTRSVFRDIEANPHSIEMNRLRGLSPVLSKNVFLLDGAQNSFDTGDCFLVAASSAGTDYLVANQIIELSDNLVVAGPHSGGSDGPIFLTMNGAMASGVGALHQPQLRLLNNTGRFSNGGHPINADEHSFAGATPSNTIIEHKRNIWSNFDAQSPMAVSVMLRGITGAAEDVVTLGQSDENVFHVYPDGLGLKESATGVNDQNTSVLPPQFVDSSRNLRTWALFCVPGSVTEDEAVVNLVRAGFPGYGPTPAVDADVYDVEKMRSWIRVGHIDKEPAHAGRGITDVDTSTPVEGIDVSGGQDLREDEIQTLLLGVNATATSMTVIDAANGNSETITLGTKPGGDQESITLPDKGSLVFGDEDEHFIVINF